MKQFLLGTVSYNTLVHMWNSEKQSPRNFETVPQIRRASEASPQPEGTLRILGSARR